jgi:hypothetical protein
MMSIRWIASALAFRRRNGSGCGRRMLHKPIQALPAPGDVRISRFFRISLISQRRGKAFGCPAGAIAGVP